MNKKGITPIVATILLVLLVVAAGAGIYVWFTAITGDLQQQIEQGLQGLSGLGGQINVILICEKNPIGEPDMVTAIVHNVGTKNIPSGTWLAVLRNTNTQTNLATSQNNTDSSGSTDTSLDANDLKSFYFSFDYDMDNSSNYIISITSPNGLTDSEIC
jgi:flagellin-like protein